MRRCTACRASTPVDRLVRYVLDDTLGARAAPRHSKAGDGRGRYVCADPACLTRAAKAARGRTRAPFAAQRIATALAEATKAALVEASGRRQLGLARRRHNGQDARLRDWLYVMDELTQAVEAMTARKLGA